MTQYLRLAFDDGWYPKGGELGIWMGRRIGPAIDEQWTAMNEPQAGIHGTNNGICIVKKKKKKQN